MFDLKFALLLTAFVALSNYAKAGQVKILTERKSAYFTKEDSGFYKGHHLRKKQIRFNAKDVQKCGSQLKRNKDDLTYFCNIDIPASDKVVKVHKIHTPPTHTIVYGRISKVVEIKVNKDGKSVRYSVKFDDSHIDKEFSFKNDEFYAIYAMATQAIIKKAMSKTDLIIETIDAD